MTKKELDKLKRQERRNMAEEELVGEYSVCQFFEDNSYECVRRTVSSKEAVQAFKHYITSLGANIGITKRVIVVDVGDCTVMEWVYGQGVVFPLELVETWNNFIGFKKEGGN